MKTAVNQLPREFAVTSAPDPGPGVGEVRLLTRGHGRTCGSLTHVLELDGHAPVLSLQRDGPASLKAVLAP